MDTALIITILELAIQYGPDLVAKCIELFDKDPISMNDIEALTTMIKRPNEYFK